MADFLPVAHLQTVETETEIEIETETVPTTAGILHL